MLFIHISTNIYYTYYTNIQHTYVHNLNDITKEQKLILYVFRNL